jgi:hypothetical protein
MLFAEYLTTKTFQGKHTVLGLAPIDIDGLHDSKNKAFNKLPRKPQCYSSTDSGQHSPSSEHSDIPGSTIMINIPVAVPKA